MRFFDAISGVGVYARPHESAIRSAPVPGRSNVRSLDGADFSDDAQTLHVVAPEDGRTPVQRHKADTSRHQLKTSRRLK